MRVMIIMMMYCSLVVCVSTKMTEVKVASLDDRPAWARTPANTIIHEDDSVVVVHAQNAREFCVAEAQGVLFEDNMQRKRVIDVTDVVSRETRYLPVGSFSDALERCSWSQCTSCKVVFMK